MEGLLKSLDELRKTCQFCDVVILSQGGKHFAHRVILAAASNFFRIMLQRDFKETRSGVINIPDANCTTMDQILEYLYTSSIDINDENAVELFRLCDRLQLTSLLERSADFLISQLDPVNCLGMRRLAQTYRHDRLTKAAMTFLLQHFNGFVETEEFLELTKEEFIEIIKQDDLNVEEEEVVYNAVFSWVDHKQDEREQYIEALIPYVRFPFIPIDFFKKQVLSNKRIMCGALKDLLHDVYSRCYDFHRNQNKDAFENSPSNNACYSRKNRIPSQIIFIVGGWTKGRTLSMAECYNRTGNDWTLAPQLCDPEGGRCYFGLAQLKGTVYIAGGYDGQAYLNTVRCFDPVMKRWKEVAPMHIKRCFASLVRLNEKIYAIAGFDGSRRLSSVEKYSPTTNQWTLVHALNVQRSDAGAVAVNGKVFVVGGYGGDSLRSVEVYDEETDTWEDGTPMNSKRSGAGVVPLADGRIFVMGGYNGTSRQKTTEFYYPDKKMWQFGPSMHTVRSNFATCVIEDSVYVIGGYTGHSTISEVERFEISTNKWFRMGSLNMARSATRAALLSNIPNIRDYLISDGLNQLSLQDPLADQDRRHMQMGRPWPLPPRRGRGALL